MVFQRPGIEQLPAYVQGRATSDAVKLSSNENPFPPLPSVQERLTEALGSINRYPDMGAGALIARIAEHAGVAPERVSVGAGSTEVLAQLIQAAAGPGDEVIFPWRSFEAYPILTRVAGATPVAVPLRDDETHDLEAMAAAVTERTRLILVCTPNNPTGAIVRASELEEFLSRVPSEVLVVIDEAYAHFVTDGDAASGRELADRFPNVAVLHTFSKAYGLAGLRVGYAIAPAAVAANLRRVALPFGVTNLAQIAACASLDAEEELGARIASLVAERGRVVDALTRAGWPVREAHGNFVWIRTGARTGEIDSALHAAGVLVRAFPDEGLRVTVGAPAENDRFLAALGMSH